MPPLTESDLALRKGRLGASEVPAALGLSPYRTALDVFLEKTGQWVPDPERDSALEEAGEFGHLLEPVIAEKYRRTAGNVTLMSGETVRHPTLAWAVATPDFVVQGPGKDQPQWLLECKNRSVYLRPQWGEPGTDEVPEVEAVQCYWQMACLPTVPQVDVGVLWGGNSFGTFRLPRNPDLIARLEEVVEEWWERHVVLLVPPPLDGSDRAREYVKQAFQTHSQEVEPATPEEAEAIARYATLKAQLAEVERAEKEVGTLLRQAIGSRAGLSAPVGRVTWKQVKDSAKTDWEAVAKDVGAFNAELLEDSCRRHTRIVPGYRRFLFTPAKESL